MKIIIPDSKDIPYCAKVYISAYKTKPWNEVYNTLEVEAYLASYLNSDTKCCFALEENQKILGVALGLIIPSIPAPYFRIEDFCIDADIHNKGYGSIFMDLLAKKAGEFGCDSILLGTQRNFPSHRFYLKNGFEEIESVLLYKELT